MLSRAKKSNVYIQPHTGNGKPEQQRFTAQSGLQIIIIIIIIIIIDLYSAVWS